MWQFHFNFTQLIDTNKSFLYTSSKKGCLVEDKKVENSFHTVLTLSLSNTSFEKETERVRRSL